MPTYEFECGRCGGRVERVLSIRSPQAGGAPLKEPCPDCGETNELARVLVTADAACFNAEQVKAGQKYPYESQRFHPKQLPCCALSPTGRPIVQSQRHERELMRKYGLARD